MKFYHACPIYWVEEVEEVFSIAILLKEMGILQNAQIIATDLDTNILEKAKSGSYNIKNMDLNEKNYIRFQGRCSTIFIDFLLEIYKVSRKIFHNFLLHGDQWTRDLLLIRFWRVY